MKIVFIEQDAYMGGVEYTTLRVAQLLDKSKFDPVIVCPREGDLPHLAREAGLRVNIVSRPAFASVSFFKGGRYSLNSLGFLSTALSVMRAASALQNHLRTELADVVVTKGLLAHFYGGLAARRLGLPCIWVVQEEVDAHRAVGFFRRILNWGARSLPDRIVVDADALLEQFDTSLRSLKNIQVIYNGIDVEQFHPFAPAERQAAKQTFGIPPQALVIGQAGRLIPLKGQVVVLQAFAQLAHEFPNVCLLFVGAPLFGGQDYENDLHEQVQALGLAERVHFSGFVADVHDGLAAMDVFVHASLETDSPLVVMEAMSCGLPVIASAVRGTAEMIVSEQDALLFPPGNVDSLGALLKRVLTSTQLRENLGKCARTSMIERFSISASVTQFQALLEELHAG